MPDERIRQRSGVRHARGSWVPRHARTGRGGSHPGQHLLGEGEGGRDRLGQAPLHRLPQAAQPRGAPGSAWMHGRKSPGVHSRTGSRGRPSPWSGPLRPTSLRLGADVADRSRDGARPRPLADVRGFVSRRAFLRHRPCGDPAWMRQELLLLHRSHDPGSGTVEELRRHPRGGSAPGGRGSGGNQPAGADGQRLANRHFLRGSAAGTRKGGGPAPDPIHQPPPKALHGIRLPGHGRDPRSVSPRARPPAKRKFAGAAGHAPPIRSGPVPVHPGPFAEMDSGRGVPPTSSPASRARPWTITGRRFP